MVIFLNSLQMGQFKRYKGGFQGIVSPFRRIFKKWQSSYDCVYVTWLKLSLPIHGYGAGYCDSPVDSYKSLFIAWFYAFGSCGGGGAAPYPCKG